jgi:SPP1 gp7 family putative phage head morphogenesis protein
VAARVSRHVSLELERILPKKKSSTRLDARRKPTEQDLVADWRKDLVARVKTVEESEHARLERMFATATRYGEAELSDRLERQFELCGWSADRLARSHTAALTAKLTEHRMTEAGIEEYVWTTMGDERVSEAHDELEGQTFRFDDPPTDSDGNTGNPGDIRPNCRCTAYPVMTTLDAGEEE